VPASVASTLLAGVTALGAATPSTQRVSVDRAHGDTNGVSIEPAVSATGRFVAYESSASNLVPSDTNGAVDIFVYDRGLDTTERVDVSSAGLEANGGAHLATISGDGRLVAFASDASNLVAGDANGVTDVFVHDRLTKTTGRVSVSSRGREANAASGNAWISANGQAVAFESTASDLVAGDSNSKRDVFLRDLRTRRTSRISVSSRGRQGNADSRDPASSRDGQLVAFTSDASTLVHGDRNGQRDVFVHDCGTNRTARVSVSSRGREGDGAGAEAEISSGGRFVTFSSLAHNLVRGDTNGVQDVFIHDRTSGRTQRISIGVRGTQANGPSRRPGSFGGTRFVAYQSFASNLAQGDANNVSDVFLYDRKTRRNIRLSVGVGGDTNGPSSEARVSSDGRVGAFASAASNLVDGDGNGTFDVFVRLLRPPQ
jgi:Tol biopolymer transport system component